MRKNFQLMSIIGVGIISLSCSITSRPASPIPAASSEIVPTFAPIETFEADSKYLAGCQLEYPTSTNSQIDYRGVYAGTSMDEDVQRLLGIPDETIQVIPSEVEWLYGSDVAVIFEENIVSAIYVGGNEPLENYLQLYGCPGMIFAVDSNQHPSGKYASLLFIYPSAGMHIGIGSFPAENTSVPYQIAYFPPGTLREVLTGTSILDDPARARPVSWVEAIK